MAAPSNAGWSGPEKISVLPTARTRRAVSASGNTSTAPPAENAFASDATITVRSGRGPSPSTVPRPCLPDQLTQCGQRRLVAVHAVDAIGEVPDAAMARGERPHQLVQAVDPVVPDEA